MDILYKQLLELNKEYVPTDELFSYLEEIKELSGRIGDCREKIKDLSNDRPLRGGTKEDLAQIQKVLVEKEKLETERKEYYTLRDRIYKKLYRMGYVVRDIKKGLL